MSALELDLHGVRARVESGEPRALEGLARDFAHFAAPAGSEPHLRWRLEARAPGPAERGGFPVLRGPGFTAYARGDERVIAYEDGATAVFDRARETGLIACADPARLHELAYLALLSRAGEALERRGLHRVHALGFVLDGSAGLLLLPSGGGKSTLALELLKDGRARLLSEDTPLVGTDARARAFPLRLGFRPDADLSAVPAAFRRPFPRKRHGLKIAVDYAYFRDAVAAEAPVRWLITARRAGPAALRPGSRARAAAALLDGLVLGRGVAQMAEYLVRPTPAGGAALAAAAAARARAALALLRAARPLTLDLGADPAAAARALLAGLQRRDEA